ncbi:unnamed protein product, partial [Echinostoma caproni]|uniref:UDP-galactose transporter n=1 Tax=Echinostoma caproni TaxID=27848 RepID=A0A183BFS9_9TREM
MKMLICVLVIHFTDGIWSSVSYLRANMLDSVKTCIPALIYLVQNRLLVSALECLDAATFQVAYQLKLLTTALFSVLILRKSISLMQWFALSLLFIGVSFVEPPSQRNSSEPLNPTLGLVYVVCAAILSGFACIYFELLLKNSTKSLWLRNLELASVSLIVGLIAQTYAEGESIRKHGFFYAFDWLVWLIILLHSAGGLIVALVVKYANNMLK